MGHHEVVATHGGRHRRPGIRWAVAVLASGSILATGCVGSVDRDEFNRVVQERGGGLSQELVIEAVDALERELDVDPLIVQAIVATNEVVTIDAASTEFPGEFDRYSYQGGELGEPTPAGQIPTVSIPDLPEGVEIPAELQDLLDGAAGDETGGDTGPSFPVNDVALDQLDRIVDSAIAAAGLREGYARTLTITSLTGEGPRIRVNVTNDRIDVTLTYGPDGRPEEAA